MCILWNLELKNLSNSWLLGMVFSLKSFVCNPPPTTNVGKILVHHKHEVLVHVCLFCVKYTTLSPDNLMQTELIMGHTKWSRLTSGDVHWLRIFQRWQTAHFNDAARNPSHLCLLPTWCGVRSGNERYPCTLPVCLWLRGNDFFDVIRF